MQQMIIANRLSDGRVVFLAPDERWVTAIADGLVVDESAAGDALDLAKRHEDRCRVVEPNLIEVVVDGDGPRPVAIREAIRAFGPTARTDLTRAGRANADGADRRARS